MFVSHYNRLAFEYIDNYIPPKAPSVTIIVGPQGLGKTCLLTHLKDKMINSDTKIILIDAAKFSKKYAYAAQNGTLSPFRKAMRTCDLFLLDNINTLIGKEKTIEELYHTIDHIMTQGGKCVLTYRGCRPNFDFLNTRFASRLKSGFTVYLREPSPDELRGFIRYYLADQPVLQQQIENAEGFCRLNNLTQIKELAELCQKKSVETGIANGNSHQPKGLLEKMKSLDNTEAKVNAVTEFVCNCYQLEPTVIFGNTKRADAVEARYMAFLLLHQVFQCSFKDIAAIFQKDQRNIAQQCLKTLAEKNKIFESLSQRMYNTGKGQYDEKCT
ncbi:DnaA/Hda family protein [Dehalobacter sp. DCM]|uniref:DnaA ATPase domain-containing protein n=1 Tax=Dehalobacter sp. DCM TaxID=2907827 RepID=UPI003081A766|nr:DnaA/Hda family protein [Dehalobacter sp. DCM]